MSHVLNKAWHPVFPKPVKPAFKVCDDGREICLTTGSHRTAEGVAEYKLRIRLMWERQKGVCCLYRFIHCCSGRLDLREATFEHEDGRGGVRGRDDRIILPSGQWVNGAAHLLCNSVKGSRRIPYNACIFDTEV